jgi:hypothetical protein
MENQNRSLSIHTDNLNSIVSLDPLLDFWEENLVPKCSHMAAMYMEIKEKISKNLAIHDQLLDVNVLNEFPDVIIPLMSAVFPAASFHKDIMGAFRPCTFESFYVSPEFQRIFLDHDNKFKDDFKSSIETHQSKKILYIYCLVLKKIYGFDCHHLDKLNIKIVADEKTGLDRYYSITPDFQFVSVKALEKHLHLSKEDMTIITDNLTNIDVLSRYIDLSKFQFTGFTIVRAVDITESQIISILEKELIDGHSMFSSQGIKMLESRLQVLFQLPDLAIGIASLQGDQIMLIKKDCSSKINCLFANSQHLSLKDIEGSVWSSAATNEGVLKISDLSKKADLVPLEQHALSHGVRSMLLAPLFIQGDIIGLLEIFTRTPNSLGSMDALILEQIIPIFSSALKRGQDDLHKQVQSIIKEKCTAVHPSVEWRFEKAAMDHMERIRNGSAESEMDSIVFKDVVPFYGQSDIRGSSMARNRGIQQDLIHQLTLGLNIMKAATKEQSWPLLKEFKYRIKSMIQDISSSVTSGDEDAVFSLLQKEIAPIFDDIVSLGPDVSKQIQIYTSALDPVKGIIYHKRKEYEESVAKLNKTLSLYLDQEDSIIQKTFPHYFEKHQTDGVDYMMYVGSSMMEDQKLAGFHIKNLTLWQIMLACGLAEQTEAIKPQLKISLDTCHLILVNHNPLSIRFRFDEKRFDVDGAYDVRQEIIKSRLDKALIKGTRERLTQPGKIAVVYSTPAEGMEIRHHIDFLTNLGKLTENIDTLDLEDMPDVNGLKAIRMEVNLESIARANIIDIKAG